MWFLNKNNVLKLGLFVEDLINRVFEKDGRIVKKTKLYRDTYKKH